jgi:nuclear pore complex protein Nup50
MKRRPDSNLTSENWDEEEKEERPGEFQRATKEELDQRKISKARRRINADQTPAPTSNIFGGFSGFVGQSQAKPNATAPSISSAFSFLTKINTTEKSASDSAAKKSDDKVDAINGLTTKVPIPSFSGSDSNQDQKMSEYMTNLKTLNKCVLDTISLHLEKTPVCILTPIFEDYESHFKKLKEKFSVTDETTKNSDSYETKIPSKSITIFPKFDLSSNSKQQPATKLFSFAPTAKPLTTTESTKEQPVLKKEDDGEKLNGIFSANPPKFVFNAQKPFTFSGVTSSSAEKHENTKDGEEGDEDEPPKVDVTPVEEKDSKYSKKCKIFVKRDSGYADKGVAMLHLKPVPNSTNTQLLVRANTSLGNILINTLLSSATPVQKMKKNNILIICVPTPDTTPAIPTSVLIRVQNEELADELLEELKKCISEIEVK